MNFKAFNSFYNKQVTDSEKKEQLFKMKFLWEQVFMRSVSERFNISF